MTTKRKWSEAFHFACSVFATETRVFAAAFTVDMKMELKRDEGLVL
jgi:hypothetical protein